jgi:hypothetical protein
MQQYVPGAESAGNAAFARNATEEFLKVLTLDPNNKVGIASIASLELNQKHWDEAEQWYQRLIGADPASADAYYSLCFIAWSRWYPAYTQARTDAGMKPEYPGPLPNAAVRQDLRAPVLEYARDRHCKFAKDAGTEPSLLGRHGIPESDQPRTCRPARHPRGILAGHRRGRSVDVEGDRSEKRATPRIRFNSNLKEYKLIRKVDPIYPPLAAQARIPGDR